jgi:hypothetical protein
MPRTRFCFVAQRGLLPRQRVNSIAKAMALLPVEWRQLQDFLLLLTRR